MKINLSMWTRLIISQEANEEINSIRLGAVDVVRLVQSVQKILLQSNAEMASEHERAVAVVSSQVTEGMHGVGDLVESNLRFLLQTQELVVSEI